MIKLAYKLKLKKNNSNKYIEYIEQNFHINTNNLETQYQHITIPKRKGGYRHIVNPNPPLKEYQKYVKTFLENILHLKPHSSAYAYIKHKDTTLNAKQHQNCKILMALDIKNFFDNIKKDNLINTLYETYDELETKIDRDTLEKILEPCFLNDSLPQGSPTSPTLSNLYMCKFDKIIFNTCFRLGLTYTRYADDIFISTKDKINPKKLIELVQNILDKHSNNTLKLNTEKTKILRIGRCYVTGVKINKDNKLSYGHEKKKELKHKIYNLFIKQQNNTLTLEECQEVLGLYSYARKIEPDYFNYLEKKYLKMFNSRESTFAKHFKNII